MLEVFFSLREEKRYLDTQLPVRSTFRYRYIIVSRDPDVDGLFTNAGQFSSRAELFSAAPSSLPIKGRQSNIFAENLYQAQSAIDFKDILKAATISCSCVVENF